MELFLSQSFEEAERPLSCKQMEKISQVVSPEYLAKYHRCLARVLTSQATMSLVVCSGQPHRVLQLVAKTELGFQMGGSQCGLQQNGLGKSSPHL